MVVNDETCDYKFSSQPRTKARLKRTYTRLTGKESPPINTWKFKLDKPMTQRYRSSPGRGILSEEYRNGKLIKLGNNNVSNDYSFDSSVVGISISVDPYTKGGMHSSHAISAVKFNKHLFCFNAWGQIHKPIDIDIYTYLALKYQCDTFLVYEGPSLQDGDPYGVCVGYASNFILEMLLKIAENKMPRNPTQKKYDEFVYNALTSRGICFGDRCVKEETIKTQWSKIERNLRKKINTPSIPITSALKIPQLKELAKKHKIKGVSGLRKDQLVTKLRNEFKAPPSRSNLENIHFKSATPPRPIPIVKKKPVLRKNQTNVKTMAIRKLRKYAGDRCIKGRSKYPRVANLRKFVLGYQQPVKSPLNRSKITTLTAQPLRRYASEHCVRGYTKYPKKTNLQKFLLTKFQQ
jgi:hypothetical protein